MVTTAKVVEEEVRDIQVFTSIVISGNFAKDRVIFATFMCSLLPEELFTDADMTRFKIRVVVFLLKNQALIDKGSFFFFHF